MFARSRLLPPYLLAEIDDLKRQMQRSGRDVIDLCLGSPDLPPPRSAIDTLVASLEEPDASRYMPSAGLPELLEAVARWYSRRHGVTVDPAREVAITLGSKEGIAHLLLGALDPGEGVIAPTPSYPVHQFGVVLAGGVTSLYRVGAGLDPLTEVRRALAAAQPRPRLLIVNFPHNPTAAVCDAQTMQALVDFAAAEQLSVISDIAYADLCYGDYRAPSMLAMRGGKERGVEFGTLSKGRSMAGWRVGFCVGNERLVSTLKTIKRYVDYGTFKPIQRAAIVALEDEAYAQQLTSTYERRRDALCDALARAGWPIERPQATMFVYGPLPKGIAMGSNDFARALLSETGVAVAPGATFGAAGEGSVRFGLIDSEERLREAGRRIGEFVAKARRSPPP